MPRRVNTAKIGVDGRSEYWSKWHNSLGDAIESLDKKVQEEANQTEERDRKDREAHMKAEIAMLVYQVKSAPRPASKATKQKKTGPSQKSQAKEKLINKAEQKPNGEGETGEKTSSLGVQDGLQDANTDKLALHVVGVMGELEKARRKQEMDRLAAERESKRLEAESIRKQEEAARLDALYHLSQTIVGEADDAIDEEAEQEKFGSLVRIHSKVKEAEALERSHSQVEKDAGLLLEAEEPEKIEFENIGKLPLSVAALLKVAQKELRAVPEDHKETYTPVAGEAANVGRMVRLQEHHIEASGTVKRKIIRQDSLLEPRIGAKTRFSLVRTYHAGAEKSTPIKIFREAAALGKMKIPIPSEDDCTQNETDEDEEIDRAAEIDKMRDEHGRRVVRTAYLLDHHVEHAKKSKTFENNGDAPNYRTIDDIVLPSDSTPEFTLRKFNKSEDEIVSDISQGVAEGYWNRYYRLERPGQNLQISKGCECKYCENPNVYQTHAYQKKWVDEHKNPDTSRPGWISSLYKVKELVGNEESEKAARDGDDIPVESKKTAANGQEEGGQVSTVLKGLTGEATQTLDILQNEERDDERAGANPIHEPEEGFSGENIPIFYKKCTREREVVVGGGTLPLLSEILGVTAEGKVRTEDLFNAQGLAETQVTAKEQEGEATKRAPEIDISLESMGVWQALVADLDETDELIQKYDAILANGDEETESNHTFGCETVPTKNVDMEAPPVADTAKSEKKGWWPWARKPRKEVRQREKEERKRRAKGRRGS